MLQKAIKKAQTIAVGGHIRPDGDCVGSCMGLWLYVKENFPEKEIHVYLEEIPNTFKFMKGTEEIRHEIRMRRSTICLSFWTADHRTDWDSQHLFMRMQSIRCVWIITSATRLLQKRTMYDRMQVPRQN